MDRAIGNMMLTFVGVLAFAGCKSNHKTTAIDYLLDEGKAAEISKITISLPGRRIELLETIEIDDFVRCLNDWIEPDHKWYSIGMIQIELENKNHFEASLFASQNSFSFQNTKLTPIEEGWPTCQIPFNKAPSNVRRFFEAAAKRSMIEQEMALRGYRGGTDKDKNQAE